MLQRIGFLATILHHPKVVILDEPLSGLDPIGRKELKDVIIEVHKEGKTVFFSSHIVPDIEEICDRVIFLKEGKLVYNGSVGHLINNSKSFDFIVTARTFGDFRPEVPLKPVQTLPENVHKFSVESAFKDKLLLELINSNMNVLSVEMRKPTLEEIFYLTQDRV